MAKIVFIHGMFVTRRCWDGWSARLGTRGFECLAPGWPLRDATPAELRARHPDPALGKLTLAEVLAHYEAVIRAQPEPPFLVGHSLGGLMVQLLLQRGLGKKGVAIDSAPPRGIVPLEWSVLRSNWPTISPFVKKTEPVLLTKDQFRYAFAHTLSVEEVARVWDDEVVPESRRMPEGALAAKIDWKAPHPPLLLIAGSEDRICTAKLNAANARKYQPAVELKAFPGRTHYTILAGEGIQEIIDYVGDWLAS
jgi:pimeloyl-ACP methyl ester carboxylesterase